MTPPAIAPVGVLVLATADNAPVDAVGAAPDDVSKEDTDRDVAEDEDVVDGDALEELAEELLVELDEPFPVGV